MAEIAHAIIGTAGHIDHGKTALIQALTGQDTDRLKEEKERGISIELGFAYFTLPDGVRAGVVDVPGHERFIRHMLAGAHGIDLVLFTVAADDGVMPQTEEHLDILHLLGVSRGIFLITKADLADAARLKDVREEIEILLDGTSLEGAPIIPVSAISGLGMEELRAEIVRQLDGFQARRPTGLFRLPLDRVFSIKGHGAVVTGTALGAEVRVGQKLRVLPEGAEARVRSIEVHGEAVERAGLCQRVALNLGGTERIALKHGDVIADAALDFVTARVDVRLELRPASRRPLRSNQRVRFFIGAAETIARVIILDEIEELAPKHSALAQLVLAAPVVALSGDRFVIRDETNLRTLGGGVVLNPAGRRSRKPLSEYRSALGKLRPFGPEAVEAMLALHERLALPASRLAQVFNLPVSELHAALRDARFVKVSLGDEEGYTVIAKWQNLKRAACAALESHHHAAPLEPGMEMEELRGRVPYEIGARDFRGIVDRLARESAIVREENRVRLTSHQVKLDGGASELGARAEKILRDAAMQPPDLKQLAELLGLKPTDAARLRSVLAALERERRIVKVATDLYFAQEPFAEAESVMRRHLKQNGEINAGTYRDLLNASRKFAIALLDHFDHSGVTTRVGDLRKLRQPN